MKGSTLLLTTLAVVAVAVTVINLLPEELWKRLPGAPDSLSVQGSSQMDTLKTSSPAQERQTDIPYDFSSIDPVPQPAREDIRFHQPRSRSRYSIEIQKSGFKLILNRDDKPFRIYNIAVGNQGSDKLDKADLITPLGNFHVVSIENSSEREPKRGRAYGPWFIRLLTGHFQTASGKAWSGIGIQGSGKASEIGRSLATDCVILQDKDLIELKEYIDEDYKNTLLPVRIVP